MKFTVAALLVASTSAVTLQDDCGGKWCNKGLAYDFDEPTRNAAKADDVAKTHAFNGATNAHEAATKAADNAAGAAKADAAAKFAATPYTDRPAFQAAGAAKADAAAKFAATPYTD